MRIVCISDTHKLHYEIKYPVPDGDVFIHAGDFTNVGELSDVIDFNGWLKSLPHQHKIVIAGNHDLCFESSPAKAIPLLEDCIYLQASSVVIEGKLFYGSPWQPRFRDWAFNLDRGEDLAEKWALIPTNTDILITHCPPSGILDRSQSGESLGCSDLSKRPK